MTLQADAEYSRSLQRNATLTVLIYSGLIVVLLPAFHFILGSLPGVAPGSDSLGLRLLGSAFSALLIAGLLLVKPLRRHSVTFQFLNTMFVLSVIGVLVVNSHNHYAYIAASLLVIIGAQQASYHISRLIVVFTVGFLVQAVYSAWIGIFWDPLNLASLGTFASAYIVAIIPAALRIKIQDSELRNRVDAQRAKEQLLEVQAIAHMGNWTYDLQTGAVEWSKELYALFELPLDTPVTALNDLYEQSVHPDDRLVFDRRRSEAKAAHEAFMLDHRLIVQGRAIRWVELHGKYEYSAAGTPVRWVGAVLDITARKRAEDALTRLARYDALTGLPNRTSILNLLNRELTRATLEGLECAVAFIDLDRFKDINDTLGHVIGDRLLHDVSRRISYVLGGAGVLGRWGGDEFVAIMPAVANRGEIEKLTETIFEAVATPFRVDDLELAITSSIGIAFCPQHGTTADELIRNADAAMYKAKHDFGSGHVVFNEELHEAVATRHHVQQEIRRALAENGLVLHYQPIIDTPTGAVRAAEALVRWVEPDGTVHLPGEFIDVAEDSRLIIPLGAWVLRAACAQAAAWRRSGRKIRVAVNVSPRQFTHPDFVPSIALALQESGAEPDDIELEITEATIMSTIDPVIATLDEIQRMGISVAIDDFGTGYSSFAYLKRFKVDSLKLDRTFVEGIERDEDLAIARSIVSVAHALGLSVTAEGVETPLQSELLEGLGCDRLQGYFFGRPQPVGDFEQQLRVVAAVGR